MKTNVNTILILLSISLLCTASPARRNIYKAQEDQESGKHTHVSVVNGKKVQVEITQHQMEGTNTNIWYKVIKAEGQSAIVYSREKSSDQWTLLPKGCVAHQPTKAKTADKCSEGWEIGKVIARTITYLALHRGHMEVESSGSSIESQANKNDLSKKDINVEEISENIIKVVNKTAQCIKQGLTTSGSTMKEMCIHKAMMKEASILIKQIVENAAEYGFKCDYEALKEGKCKIIENAS